MTFSTSYPHDRLKANLPGEVAIEIFLELLQLGRVVDEMKGWVVKDAACRILGDACWETGAQEKDSVTKSKGKLSTRILDKT